MINSTHLKLDNKLTSEYNQAFTKKDNRRVFIFLRKYIKFIESDNQNYQRLFLLENPLKYKRKNQKFMNDFNKKCWDFLKQVKRAQNARSKGNGAAGEAACYMGAAYEYGLFGKQIDYGKAFSHYTISAQLNHDFGTFRLAQCYEKGIGTSRNIEKAAYFFRCVAKLGLVDGMHVYGSILINGLLGCRKDVKTGLHFLSLSSMQANKIYPYALFDVGRWYENKFHVQDVAVDEQYAYDLYSQGASLDDPNCLFRLAIALDQGELSQSPNQNKSFECFKRAAELGQIDAQMYLCEIYCTGSGSHVTPDPGQSYYWGLKAATGGQGRAAFILGDFCKRGFGTTPSTIKSLWWMLIAKEMGCEEAIPKINELNIEIERIDAGPHIKEPCCGIFCC